MTRQDAAQAAAGTGHPAAVDGEPLVELRTGPGRWTAVCRYRDLVPGRGVAVLVGAEQAAVFRDRSGAVYAVQNYDPFGGCHVIARGITGSRSGRLVVISPMYKQAFDLRTGECLDEQATADGSPARLRVWPVRIASPSRAGSR